MRKFTFLLFLIFTISCYSQTSTEKYNSLLRRYEYFDGRGNMTGYKQYNTYLNQWEYYDNKSQSSGYQIQPAQSSVNLDLVQKTLSSRQSAYDNNLKSIQITVKSVYKNIDYLVLNLMTSEPKELDYKYANHLKYLFETKCVQAIEQKGYDYSSNSTTNMVNDWLVKNSLNIIKQELNFIEDRTYYERLINSYISLYN